jgi:hypothetical protein
LSWDESHRRRENIHILHAQGFNATAEKYEIGFDTVQETQIHFDGISKK